MAVAVKQKVRFGPYELDVHSGELWKDGTRLKLQPQPIQILATLLEHPGELVTREELQHRLWPNDTFVDFEQGLNTAVRKLRAALCDEAETPKYIETLPKRGYRFVGEVLPAQASQPEPVVAAPLPVPHLVQTSVRKPRKWLWLAALAGLVFIGVFLVAYREVNLPPPRIITTKQLTHTRLPKNFNLATDGSRVYFGEQRAGNRWGLVQVSTIGGEVSEIPTNIAGPFVPSLGISPSGSELLVDDGNNYWIQPIPAGSARRAPIPAGAFVGEGWTWQGNFLYSDGHQLFRVNSDGTNRKRLFTAPSIGFSSLSPDGKHVRFNANFTASVWPGWRVDLMESGIDGSESRLVFPQMKGQTWLGGWTVDGKLFYFVRGNGSAISLWAVREPALHVAFVHPEPTLLYAGPLELRSPVASRSSKELFVIGADRQGELAVYNERSSGFVPYLGGISASFVAFSPDHQSIAYVEYPDGTLWRSRVDGSQRMQLTFPPMGVLLPRWSPDGKSIAFMDWFGSEYHAIYTISAEGGQPSLLVTGPLNPGDPTWSPDGQSIVYGEWGVNSASDLHLAVLDLKTMATFIVPGSEGFFSPRLSPDGKYLAAISKPANAREEHSLVLYDFAQKRWQTMLKGVYLGWPAWTHDSRLVYVVANNMICRVDVKTGEAKVVVNLEGIHWTSFAASYFGWFDLTPDDRIMILRDTGTEEIYALQLEY